MGASRQLGLLALLLCFFASGVAVRAASEISAVVGFGNRFRSGLPTPIAVTVQLTDQSFQGEIIVEFVAGNALERGAAYTIRKELSISGGVPSVQRFLMPLEVSSYPLSVRLERSGVIVAETEIELRPLNTDRVLVAGISRRPSLDALIGPLTHRYGKGIEIAYPRIENLPSDPAGWSAVSLAVWHDFPPDAIGPESAEALSNWITGGGELLILGGPWLAGRSFPPPLPLGTVGFPDSGGSYPLGDDAGSFTAAGPGESAARIFRQGRGRIMYFPRDMVSPAADPDTRRIFLDRMASTVPRIPRTRDEREIDAVTRAYFEDNPGLLPPPGNAVLVGGIFAAAAGGILAAGLRIKSGKGRLAQLVGLTAVAAGAALAALAMSPFRSFDVQRSVEIVLGDGDGREIIRRTRLIAGVATEMSFDLPPGGVVRRLSGGDLEIVLHPGRTELHRLHLDPWRAVEVEQRRSLSAGEAPPVSAPENLVPLESYAWSPESPAAPAPENLVPPESHARAPESSGGASEFLVGRLPDAARGVPRFYLRRRDDE